jgi:hypothetical protein
VTDPPTIAEPAAQTFTAASLPLPPAVAAAVDDRPELAVGGAFAGGLLLALILKRLAR